MLDPAPGSCRSSNGDDFDESLEALEVLRVARVQRKTCGTRGRSDEEVQCARAAGLAAPGDFGCVDPPIRASPIYVERERIKCGFCALQAILAASTFVGVGSCMRTRSEFRHRDGADSELKWELASCELFEFDHDRGVDDSPWVARPLRHEGLSPETPRCRDRREAGKDRLPERPGIARSPCRHRRTDGGEGDSVLRLVRRFA